MKLKPHRTALYLLATLLMSAGQSGIAQEEDSSEGDSSESVQQFGGPASVPGQLAGDARLTESISDVTFGDRYFDWKEQVKDERGLNFTLDYTTILSSASQTLGADDTFLGGAEGSRG